MTSGRKQLSGDAEAIARASRAVTVQITLAAAAIVILVVAVCVAFIIDQSQPSELLEKPAPGQTKIYVDSDDMLIALVAVGAIAIVLASILSWLVARRAVRPLGEALRIQRTFVADASHELRTPLAVVGARAEVLKQEIADGADTTENLGALQEDVRVLSDIITDLLLAAAPAQPQTEHDVNAAEIVEETIHDLQLLADRRGISLKIAADRDIVTRVPETALRRCVVALVDNAIGHSPDGASVEVIMAGVRGRPSFTLIVTDHGSGITGIDHDRIFERFARSEAGGPRSRSGFGIGLALVRDLADRYGGTIAVTETSGSGTTFTLTLPRI